MSDTKAAVTVEITEAVKDKLEKTELSQSFTCERSYADWDLALEEATPLRVDIVTVATQIVTTLSAQGKLKYLVQSDIAVRQKFGQDKQSDDTGRIPNAEIDPLVLLVEEINELFTKFDLPGVNAIWQETRIVVLPHAKHLREENQFTGIVRIQFRRDQKI